MLLSDTERDNRIDEFLTRKLKEFDLDSEVPAIRSANHSELSTRQN